jgi:TPR repeat protein
MVNARGATLCGGNGGSGSGEVTMKPGTVLAVGLAWALLSTASAARADFLAGQTAFDQSDFGTAHAEWTDAAVGGDARAQFELGLMLANGVGVPRDVISAYAWLMLAHKGGISGAKSRFDALQKDYIPRHCHFDALALVREYETGHPEKLVAGGRQNSRCWNFKQY